MALRRGHSVTFRPDTLSDAVDGTNAPAGAMVNLANLVPDPATSGIYVCRPAAAQKTAFAGFNAPGFVSAQLVVGDIVYGMIASARNAGKDEPFVYNLATNTFLTVPGITNGNTPASPPSTGAWTPPIIAQVGSRVIVTHPGFPGGAIKFGWFDISGFTETTVANTASASAVLTGAPPILGVQPGMTISGAGVPAGTTVVSTDNFVLVTTGDTHTNTTLDNLGSTTGVAIGQAVAGVGIPVGTTVVAVPSSSSVTLSNAATASASGEQITFTGTTITMSAAATATATNVTLVIAGGTMAAPLWGSGDTDINPLPSVPVGVAQFNGRAYYALGVNGIVFSDSGFASRVSNNPNVQALTTDDGLAVTAIAPLELSAPLTGGIVQALIAFEGISKMQQITGDQATGNLAMNALPVATGTLAPLSIFTCNLGTGFVSPDGMRIVRFDGSVTDPIGEAGTGITVPFIYSLVPSRMCAAANVSVIRITTQNASNQALPQQEYWYHIARKLWTGPHTFQASTVQPWRNSFVMTPVGLPAGLWQSDPVPVVNSSYVENGMTLGWAFSPSPLPDTGLLAENALIEAMWAFQLPNGITVSVSASDQSSQPLDSTTIVSTTQQTLWGQFNWGQGLWGGSGGTYQQYPLYFFKPLVFKQLNLVFSGQSGQGLRIGNGYMRYQELGYIYQAAS